MVADFSGFCLGTSLFRRGLGTERTHETLLKMVEGLQEATLVVADSYFGGLPALEGLVSKKFHALLACRKDRPTSIFKSLCQGLKEGETSSSHLKIGETPFFATATANDKVIIRT